MSVRCSFVWGKYILPPMIAQIHVPHDIMGILPAGYKSIDFSDMQRADFKAYKNTKTLGLYSRLSGVPSSRYECLF